MGQRVNSFFILVMTFYIKRVSVKGLEQNLIYFKLEVT